MHSVIVKLPRTTMIIPVVAALGVIARRRDPDRTVRWHTVIPWFLVSFIAAAVLENVGLAPVSRHAALPNLAIVLITMAFAGIGLSTRLGQMRRAGYRPLVLSTVTWMTVALTELVLQVAVGSW